MITRSLCAVVCTLSLLAGCGGPDAAAPPQSDPPATAPASAQSPATAQVPATAAETDADRTAAAADDGSAYLLAVGDIASCRTDGDEEVAEMLEQRRARIALLGDVVYDSGTLEEFAQCFDPAWGDMRRRLRPAPGNHEYRTPGAAGYFDYFGDRAGTAGKGWYAYNLGNHWRAIVLNGSCEFVGGCGPDSPQGRWLQRQLDRHSDRHILAYWHQPLFSSGRHGSNAGVAAFWGPLYDAGAKIVLNGHDHTYERFAPQNPDGERRRKRGIRQFVVGTGGYVHYPFEGPPLPNTQVRNDDTFGALQLRLDADGYRWRFLPVDGEFTDRGRHTF